MVIPPDSLELDGFTNIIVRQEQMCSSVLGCAAMTVQTEQLPRGRHHLSREEVQASQRQRMLLAIAAAMADKGYAGTSVADVIRRAGVSRETFYQQFSSKLDCFMSAFDVAGQVLLARLDDTAGHAAAGDEAPIDRFDRAVGVYLESLATQPALARVFLVEVYAAGPEAIARRAALQGAIVDRMARLLGLADHDRFACEVLVAGVGALVTAPLVADDLASLHRLRTQLVDLVHRALPLRPTSTTGEPS
jgi:AcrR family transcriptional regulator